MLRDAATHIQVYYLSPLTVSTPTRTHDQRHTVSFTHTHTQSLTLYQDLPLIINRDKKEIEIEREREREREREDSEGNCSFRQKFLMQTKLHSIH